MASILSAGTTTSTALNLTADTSGSLILASNNNVTAVTIATNQNVTFANNATFIGNVNAPNTFGFKNRIINGAMVIDQRNAGASVTPANNDYTLDRWQASVSQSSKLTVQQSSTAATGFSNSLKVTSSSAYSVGASDYFMIQQKIEGFNTYDLAWGTANAKTVTLSFQVYSSLTGTFGGVATNSATDRSYPFTYTISSANTWTSISVTIAGDTSGTWIGATNGVGIMIRFGLGVGSTYSGTAGSWSGSTYFSATGATSVVGTNGATFYITGVQLETGSTATSFDYRPYGTEFNLCLRYCYIISGNSKLIGTGYNRATTRCDFFTTLPVTMRASPTATVTSGTNYYYVDYSQAATNMNDFSVNITTTQNAIFLNSGLSGLTAGSGNSVLTQNASAFVSFSAEL